MSGHGGFSVLRRVKLQVGWFCVVVVVVVVCGCGCGCGVCVCVVCVVVVVCVGVWVVWGLCGGCVLCVVCGVTHAAKKRCTFKNAPVCTGNTSTCGARVAGTHGDVLNVHMGGGGGGVNVSSACQKFAHVGLSRAPEVHQTNLPPIIRFT